MTAVHPHRPISRQQVSTQPAHTFKPTYVGTKTYAQEKAEHKAWLDAQLCVERCARCEWQANGPAGQVRDQFAAHLHSVHPEVRVPKRKRWRMAWEKAA